MDVPFSIFLLMSFVGFILGFAAGQRRERDKSGPR